jgi:hypothetical protein
MNAETLAERRARRHALTANLLHEKQIDRYGLFTMTTEGRRFPDGSESASGFVVASSGDVFSFWTGASEGTAPGSAGGHRSRLNPTGLTTTSTPPH